MFTDDEAARKAKAQRLRERIKQLDSEKPEGEEKEEEATPPRPKSPREFIQEKMRELDEKDKQ